MFCGTSMKLRTGSSPSMRRGLESGGRPSHGSHLCASPTRRGSLTSSSLKLPAPEPTFFMHLSQLCVDLGDPIPIVVA